MVRKVIVNECFGGYGWSHNGTLEVLKLKGIKDLRFFLMSWDQNDYKEVSEQEFIAAEEGRFLLYETAVQWKICAGDNTEGWTRYSIEREDPEAIAVLEKFGTGFCSGSLSKLCVEKFDDEFYDYSIDNYDGDETLITYPRLTREQVLRCKTVEEVADILQKIGVIKEKERSSYAD